MISSPIEEIKNRLDIIEVIGGYIKLQKAGVNYRAICPFHSEKRPSFFVSPSRQIWHCFGGCSEGGDIFKFVMKIEGVEFGDALRILAQKAGVELKKQPPELKTERQRLYEICELAAKFFEKQLEESKVGNEAKKYLLSRGITEESLKRWRVGYAPDTWEGLSDFLTSRGYQKEETEKAGLILKSEKGSFYDRFRGRIVFPIFDLNYQVIGFGGRVFREKDKKEIAKYVNTPQTLLYDKSRILYGLNKAKVEIRKKDFCILVEGYIDLIMVSQAGFENVVATSGTALTPFQLKILKRYTENLLTAFDMDVAGDTATKRGIDLAQIHGFNVKVITLPQGMDPADMVLKDPKGWADSLGQAKSIMDFYFESTFFKFDKENPEGKQEISKVLLPVIKRIPNKIVQSHWIGQLAKKIGVKDEDVAEELKKIKLDSHAEIYGLEPEEIKELPLKTRRELLEERLVMLALKSSQAKEIIQEKEITYCFPQIKEIFNNIKNSREPDSKKAPSELIDFYNRLCLQSEIEEIEEKEIVSEVECCLKEINSLEFKDKLNNLSRDIKRAEEEKDSKKIGDLTKQFNLLIQNEKAKTEKEN